MSFNGTEGGQITLQQGADLTAQYRAENPNEIKGHFFGREILTQLLQQNGCKGIRMYYGVDKTGKKELVLVGADANEDDILDLVADLSLPCPGVCGNANVLNS